MEGRVAVRPLGAGDRAAVIAVARSLPEWFNDNGLQEIERDLQTQRGWVAERGDGVVGWAMVEPAEGGALQLTWIGVARPWHRRGVGRALLAQVREAARSEGRQHIFVSTVADSVDYEPYAATRAFYRANGFEDFRVDPGFFKDPRGDYDRLMLRLPL